MIPSTNFQTSLSDNGRLPVQKDQAQGTASELVFSQDTEGNYLSFHWQESEVYGISPDLVLKGASQIFSPVDVASYQNRIKRVLSSLSPERFKCHFYCGEQTLLLDLVMSPVLLPDRLPSTVVVAGYPVSAATEDSTPAGLDSAIAYPTLSLSSDRYQKLLTQIAWNIRRTLDLPIIWQQTVKGLGKALSASRCVVCPYKPLSQKVEVIAEYCEEGIPSMRGQEFWIAEDPCLRDAISTLKPVIAQRDADSLEKNGEVPPWHSMLVVATCYQDQPNGLIILHQCDRVRLWSEAELELMQDLADQVGTAVAHATLFADSQALTTKLQLANNSLKQQHRELEEARSQAEAASRLKSEFLANTSHELRTPLNGMIGFLKLIMDGMADNPEEQNEFIKEAYRSALHLLNIINDVLDIARIEAGRLEIEMLPVKLSELLEDVEDLTRSQILEKKLSFKIEKPPTEDEIILFGNYQRLLQVMLNLVGNAIKFTHEGGITVGVEIIKKKVTVHNQELPGMAKVRVADTGIGVSLDKQDKLFQSFSQVDGSRTRQYGGTGLGLAITQKLVEAMGGVVNFYSMGEGLGSTVTFTVPLYQEPLMISP
ncbi:MAG: GAF domain-containing protein [Leptolyngbyaceae cyanobacterium HOT.MB2.61]|nr:GAF domain-containing protein [Leptolyngbyaceae cyanobacterium HOT.MB2.61]